MTLFLPRCMLTVHRESKMVFLCSSALGSCLLLVMGLLAQSGGHDRISHIVGRMLDIPSSVLVMVHSFHAPFYHNIIRFCLALCGEGHDHP